MSLSDCCWRLLAGSWKPIDSSEHMPIGNGAWMCFSAGCQRGATVALSGCDVADLKCRGAHSL